MTDPDAPPRYPPVSVVIATRDRPGLLERAVGHVLRQDYPGPVQCVVVFDQADPRPLDITTPAGRELLLVPNTRRRGLPGARNSGVAAATGALLAFCDDDDLWLPTKLRRQADLLADAPELGAVSCGIRLRGPHLRRDRCLDRSRVTLPELLADRVMEVHSSTVVVRRDTWLAAGPADEEIPGGYSEDYDWLLRVAAHTPIGIVPAVLVVVDWHGGSFYFGRWSIIVQAQRYLLAKHPELAGSRTGVARIRGQIAFALAAGGQRRAALRELAAVARLNPREKRIFATLPVVLGLLTGERVLRAAQRRGRGV